MRDYAELRSRLLSDLNVDECMLTSDMHLSAANALWLKNSFWKKFQDVVSDDAEIKALDLFKKSNRACQGFRFNPESIQEEQVIGEVKNLLDDVFFSGPDFRYSFSDILENIHVGPGASIGAKSYNFYTKLFDSSLTGTSEKLYREYRFAISASPTWSEAEKARDAKFGHDMVVGSRLSSVPKTSEISRTICTEPVLNMLFQKGVCSVLERGLRRDFKINLSYQPELNRQLAKRGSVDGSFGTIDLSSASDSISFLMLKEVLPPHVTRWLDLCRSPTVIYPDGSEEELYMVSSMGNAFTFPLETMLFSSIVVACYRVLGITPKYGRAGPSNFAVFGDDIIVRSDAYNFTCKALRLFGFTVNEGKSFNEGYFRESCGGDYYRGHNIRGVYCKSLKTDADVYSVINRLIRWTARTGVFLTESLKLLRSWVKFNPIPFQAGDTEGIKIPYAPTAAKRCRDTGGVFYSALCVKAVSFKAPDDPSIACHYPKRSSRRRQDVFYNAGGLMVAFVGGFIRDGRIGLRSEINRFKVRRRVTSSWSYVNAAALDAPVSDWIVTAELYELV